MYTLSIDVFEGPFDLLLQLIEREKLDISAVSLSQVADQFLAHVAQMEDTIEAGELADFLAIAARLVLIKSRLLLPRASRPDDEELEEDPAEALARQLREYKRFKEAAGAMRAIEDRGLHAYPRAVAPPELEHRLSPEDFSLAGLLEAARAAFASVPAVVVPAGVVVPFMLTIQDQIRRIRQVTTGGRSVTFRSLVDGARYRYEIVVTLLAVLELIKRRQVQALQRNLFGEIEIAPVPGAEITDEEPENGNGAS